MGVIQNFFFPVEYLVLKCTPAVVFGMYDGALLEISILQQRSVLPDPL